MLCLVSGCNLVASKASFICIISKQWSFSGSEGQLTDTGSHAKSHISIAKDFMESKMPRTQSLRVVIYRLTHSASEIPIIHEQRVR